MEIIIKNFDSKKEMYAYIIDSLPIAAEESDNAISVLANASALLKLFLSDTNWAGFYLMDADMLKLGPFQGKPAVTSIAMGQGVCGTAAIERKTQVVEDVHACDNHIACDISTSSEIVVPMIHGEELIGVLDIDSRQKARFDAEDQAGLEAFVGELIKYLKR